MNIGSYGEDDESASVGMSRRNQTMSILPTRHRMAIVAAAAGALLVAAAASEARATSIGPVAAQAVPVESASIIRGEDGCLVRIVLVLRVRRSVSEAIARRIQRLVDVAEVRISPSE
jgi:hypothetical protein